VRERPTGHKMENINDKNNNKINTFEKWIMVLTHMFTLDRFIDQQTKRDTQIEFQHIFIIKRKILTSSGVQPPLALRMGPLVRLTK
jgi:hypothetical protein